MLPKTYEFTSELWIWSGAKAAWHFLSLTEEASDEIKFFTVHSKRGWGSVPVTVTIGGSKWKTSIFPSSKTQNFIVPIKKAVRTAEGIKEGDDVTFSIYVAE